MRGVGSKSAISRALHTALVLATISAGHSWASLGPLPGLKGCRGVGGGGSPPTINMQQTSSSDAAAAAIAAAKKMDRDIESCQYAISRQEVDYKDGSQDLKGLAVWPEETAAGAAQKLPCILIAHTAVGLQEDFMYYKLEAVASRGFLAFGVDMFGAGRALWDKEEAIAAREPLRKDRSLMARRILSGYEAMRGMPMADGSRCAAMGYCFGGMAVLDLARSGEAPDLKCTSVFHGILDRPSGLPGSKMQGQVLVCHGGSDPFVTADMMSEFQQDVQERNGDVTIHTYSDAMHAFTRPEKTLEGDRAAGLQYSPTADAASWAATWAIFDRHLN